MAKTQNGTVTESPSMDLIHYFIIEDDKYRRVFAKLISLKPQALTVWINGNKYTIESEYNLLDLRVDDVILAFVFKKEHEKYAKLYPLPLDDVSKFAEDAVVAHYPLLTPEQMGELQNKDKGVRTLQEVKVQLQNQIKSAYKNQLEQQYAQVNFARTLPVSRRVLNQNAGINCTHKGNQPSNPSALKELGGGNSSASISNAEGEGKSAPKRLLRLKNKKPKEFAKRLFDVKFKDQEEET